MLMGEYHHSIDDKGRIIIPSKLRSELGERFIITRGLDKCLSVYPLTEWNHIISKLKEIPFTDKDARGFMRSFLSGATECEFDKQGRINIASHLITHAELSKECVVIGVYDRLEIWSKDSFQNYMSSNEEKMSDIADHLFKTNLNM